MAHYRSESTDATVANQFVHWLDPQRLKPDIYWLNLLLDVHLWTAGGTDTKLLERCLIILYIAADMFCHMIFRWPHNIINGLRFLLRKRTGICFSLNYRIYQLMLWPSGCDAQLEYLSINIKIILSKFGTVYTVPFLATHQFSLYCLEWRYQLFVGSHDIQLHICIFIDKRYF